MKAAVPQIRSHLDSGSRHTSVPGGWPRTNPRFDAALRQVTARA